MDNNRKVSVTLLHFLRSLRMVPKGGHEYPNRNTGSIFAEEGGGVPTKDIRNVILINRSKTLTQMLKSSRATASR